ncbi:AAA family ATPase [Kaistia soli]|uniref:AAA family ATPase n=1 Tax=Kaistia soli TaxID=446684 RepID=UPI001AECD12E|nr:ATP-binding protein [Kaistia soli]
MHLICGLPGSGKTTLARQLEEDGAGVRLSPDDWILALGFAIDDEEARTRVEDLQWTLAQRILAGGSSVILENGFWTREERSAYRSTALQLGAETRLHFLDVPLHELTRRLAIRNRDLPKAAQVDPGHLEAWSRLFERPDGNELAG